MKKLIVITAALAGTIALTGAADAAGRAVAVTDLNLRAGPSTDYPAVDVIGGGNDVHVFGCLSNRSWCDVGYNGIRGWASSNYLEPTGRPNYTGPRAVDRIGAPVITFSLGSYWDNHYRSRPFYSHRDRYDRNWHGGGDRGRADRRYERRDGWDNHDRGNHWDGHGDRGDHRADRRDDRRDYRDGRRDDRRDYRDDQRDDRHDRRGDMNDRGPDQAPVPLYRVR